MPHLVRGLLVALALPLVSGCVTAHFDQDVYRDDQVSFRTADVGPNWRQSSVQEGQVVFQNPHGGAMLASGTCSSIKDVPLDVLANQALFGVADKKESARETFTLDGRAALRVRLVGTLDGVPVDLDLIVVKKDGCIYDLQLVAGAAVFAEREGDFGHFVSGFRILTPSRYQ